MFVVELEGDSILVIYHLIINAFSILIERIMSKNVYFCLKITIGCFPNRFDYLLSLT